MAREDILTALQIALTQKEGPPPADDNTLIQKMIAPNETMTASDQGVTLTASDPTKFVWGGNNAQGQYINPGWKWSQGEYYKSYKGVILNDNPLAYYRMDETSGTVAHDASGNTFDAIIGNGVVLGQTGPLNTNSKAMSFNGSSMITLPNNVALGNDGLSEMAVEAWIYPTAYTSNDGHQAIFEKNGEWYLHVYNDGSIQAWMYGVTTAYQKSSGVVSLNQWAHVGWSYDGAQIDFYINGQPSGSVSASGTIRDNAPSPPSIGGEYNATNRYFTGMIAEPAMYSHSLTAQQWLNHYTARKAVYN